MIFILSLLFAYAIGFPVGFVVASSTRLLTTLITSFNGPRDL